MDKAVEEPKVLYAFETRNTRIKHGWTRKKQWQVES